MNFDHLVIATAACDRIRIYAVLSTGLVAEAARIHQTWPTASAAFGRLLSGAVIMGTMNDNLVRLTVELSGNGPLGRILAISNQRGMVKGDIAHPEVDLELNRLGKLNVAAAVGSGHLSVLKDLGLKKPYQGIVPLQNGEIAADLAYYLTKSEQIPSAVALGVLVAPDGSIQAAGGFIVQLMPGADLSILELLEQKLAQLPPVTTMLNNGMSLRELIATIGNDFTDLKFLEELPVRYFCDCSWQRFRGPLLSLGTQELETIFLEQGRLEVYCHFCHKIYQYENKDLSGDLDL